MVLRVMMRPVTWAIVVPTRFASGLDFVIVGMIATSTYSNFMLKDKAFKYLANGTYEENEGTCGNS